METSDLKADKNENGRSSWINHDLFKAFVAGFVLALGWFGISLLVIEPFGLDKINENEQTPYFVLFNCLLPITSVYLLMLLTNKLLKPLGFEGVKFHQRRKLPDFPKLVSAASGCLLVQILLAMIMGTAGLVFVVGSEYMGETKFKILIAVVVVGIFAYFAFARRVSHNQAKAQQEFK
ncbi:MAG: hypothetical protein GY805_02365 [Chloroflexi bacterium]|nr:hypothetical protein [Chloroflexota bacterium]